VNNCDVAAGKEGPLKTARRAGGPRNDRLGDIDLLWRAYKKRRCADARDRLIVHYAPLVHFVAARVGSGVPASVEHGDLVSYGAIGLIEAVDRYDPSRRVEFETYAVTRIRGAMLDEMRALDWVPRSVRSRVRRVERAKTRLRGELLREPTLAELAADAERASDRGHGTNTLALVALEELVALGGGEDGDHVTVLDTIEDTSADDLGVRIEADETRAALLDAMADLGDREYKMILLYYFQGFTLSRIGKLFGVTESRVSQIHSKALRELACNERVRACAEGFGWSVPIAPDLANTILSNDLADQRIA
jgi:RNA polymerase sigma factor for flagellar operon FliA